MLAVLLQAAAQVPQPGPHPSPPPEPPVRPIVSAPVELDLDWDKVDDRITSEVAAAQSMLARAKSGTTETAAAQAALDERIEVELIFDRQITQAQMDSFLSVGGRFERVFTHVSYGWTGTIERRRAPRLAGLMGPSLLGVLAKKPAILHMDEAGRTGRVRPQIWDLGIDGQSAGPGRVTIAILDTGVDASHPDLAGRAAYWKDWTADDHASAEDLGHHGSHVAGIATGAGTAAGVNPSSLSYMDLGTFPTTSGSFYPSPIHIPASLSSFNWTSQMRWKTGSGVQARLGHVYTDTVGAYGLIGSYTSGNSTPLVETNLVANPNAGGTNRFSAYATKNSGGGAPEYAVENTIDYTGVGDGYNALSGVAPGAAWAGFKVFTDDGGGSSTDIDEALDDMVAQRMTHDIKVANMSLGYDGSYTPTRDKTNTAALNGIVVCVAAGNSGDVSSGVAGEVGDPGRAHYAITVASSSDINQLTDYSCHGFASPGDASAGDQDMKPDIMAPGGSTGYQSNILSVDSNTGDSWDSTGQNYSDAVEDNYLNIQGTSMASPFAAGCAALVIDALQQSGESWDFTGGAALNDVLRVKQLLLMTATESNLVREAGPSGNPSLQRGGKDINEGFGLINPDAAVEALMNPVLTGGVFAADGILGPDRFDKRCWARRAELVAGNNVEATLTVPAGGDYDLYLYSGSPDIYGNPVILASSVNAGAGADEQINFTPSANETGYILVKRVSGGSTSEAWSLSGDLGGVDLTPPTVVSIMSQNERMIDIVFSEQMGTGVTGAGNYAVSGPGAGTLTANPASVTYVSGFTYRLSWNSPQEMLDGALVTVTVSGVNDAAGNGIGTPPSASAAGVGVPPSVILNSAASDPTSVSPIPVAATLSEDATNFTSSDVSVSNATVQNFTGSGSSYSFELLPSGQGPIAAMVSEGTFSDAAGNLNGTSASLSRIYDSVPPTVALSTTAPEPTSSSTISVTVTLSEASANFTGADIDASNGAVQNFAGSGTSYSFELLPTGQGTVTASVAAGAFTDGAGNSNAASNQLSRTFDSTAPTVSLTTDASEPTSVALVAVTATLSESSGNFAEADLVVGNASVQNFSGSGDSYAFELIPTGQGAVTVSVPAGRFTDAAGNLNTASSLLSRTFDSLPPQALLASGEPGFTNSSPISVSVTLNESSGDFAAGDMTTTNGIVQNFSGTGVSYSFELVPSVQGAVETAIPAGAFTDAAGNGNLGSDLFSRTFDSVSPTVVLSSTAPDPTSTTLITVTADLSEPSADFTATDLTVSTATISNFTGFGDNYSFNLTPTSEGSFGVAVTDGALTDAAGNSNSASNQLIRVQDITAPVVTFSSVAPDPTNSTPIAVAVMLGESSAEFEESDLLTTNAVVQNFTGTGAAYGFELVPVTQGEVSVAAILGAFADSAGNPSVSGELSRTFDSAGPIVGSVTAVDRTNVDLTYLEANALGANATNATMYTISGAGAGTVAANPDSVALQGGQTYRLTWSAGSMIPEQTIVITVQGGPGGVFDTAGNPMGTPSAGSTLAVPVRLTSFSAE